MFPFLNEGGWLRTLLQRLASSATERGDTEVLVPLQRELYKQRLEVHSEPVVEWRALTVWLLDKIAVEVRQKLRLSAEQLPLASILQGGTWNAGRRLAEQRRGGAPPLDLAIDGTVF